MNFERLWHWERFEPNVGNNRELPEDERLYFEIGVGLTYAELERAREAGVAMMSTPPAIEPGAAKPTPDEVRAGVYEHVAGRMAEILAPYIRVGNTRHSINGKPISSLRDYLRFAVEQPGSYNALELTRMLGHLNSFEGSRELFSAPPSGGFTSTPRRNSEQARSQMGGH